MSNDSLLNNALTVSLYKKLKNQNKESLSEIISYTNQEISDLNEKISELELKEGPKGDQGPVGPKGDPGNDGIQGARGPMGFSGETGPKGDKGDPGPKGDKGDTGPQGIDGPQGPIGETGEQGLKGDKGDRGQKGEVGPIGPQGLQGLKGDQGEVGPIGPQGLQGLKGDQGEVGPAGNDGPQGLQGPKGDQGEIGPAGNDGPQGLPGSKGDQGNRGEKGEKGDKGDQGDRGEKGDQGDPGKDAPDIRPKFEALLKDFSGTVKKIEQETNSRVNQKLNSLNYISSGGGSSGGGSARILDNDDVEFKQLGEVSENSILIFDDQKKKFITKELVPSLSDDPNFSTLVNDYIQAGLGTIAVQNANNVNITGGSISGVTNFSSTGIQDNANSTAIIIDSSGNVLPATNILQDLGSASNRWRDLYLSGSTINLGNSKITTDSETGVIVLVPPTTSSNPNPSGFAINDLGKISKVETLSGVVTAQSANRSALVTEDTFETLIVEQTITANSFIGNVTGTVSDISNHTTVSLIEDPSANTSSGTMYFTNARARAALSDSTGITYDSTTGVIGLDSAKTNNWDTAYGWGDHSVEGYLKSTSLSDYATETYVDTQVANLVDSAPETLNTLNELATALGDDPNFATSVSNSIGTKWTQDNTKISNWDTAYGWGNHASAGYLTSFTETDPTVPAHVKSITSTEKTNWDTAYGWGDHDAVGYLTSFTETDPTVPSHVKTITTTNISNWDTAYGWGNHASAGYLTSIPSEYLTETEGDARYLSINAATLPDQTGHADQFLTTNGTTADWATVDTSLGDTAYGWGNHSSAGYLTSFTETDPTVPAHVKSITTTEKANWTTAYGWGNHASAGYLTGNQTITLTGDVSGSGTTSISVTVADNSHNHDWVTSQPLTSADDLDNITSNGSYRWTGNAPINNPSGTYHNMFVQSDGGQPTQFVWGGSGDSSQDIHIRRRDSGVWKPWTTFWNDGNDGSGSGLDADLLDGQQGSYYAPNSSLGNYLPLAGGNLTGGLTGTTAAFDSIYLNTNDRIYGGTSYRAVEASPTGSQLQLGEGYGLINMFKTQDAVSELKLWNNRQDAGNIGVSKVSGYNGVEVANMTFYRGGGGASGYIRFQYKPTNEAALTDVFQVGNGSTVNYGVDVLAGGYRIGGTTVIDSSRNLTNIGTLNGGTPWHSGNDGSGSGLDADLLDGQQGSYYATADSVSAIAALDPVITLTGAVTGSGTMTNLGSVSIATTATADPTLTLTGDVTGSATFTNLGNATLTAVVADDSHNHIISNVDGLQTALDAKLASSSYTASDVLTKIKTVDGTGSGLDADLLDGVQGSSFLRSDAADTSTGLIEFQAGIGVHREDGVYVTPTSKTKSVYWKFTEASQLDSPPGSGSWRHVATIQGWTQHSSSYPSWQMSFGNGAFGVRQSTSNSAWAGWQTVWTSGNDGSGSGLDADLLDGLQASQFLRKDTSDTMSGDLQITGSTYGGLSIGEANTNYDGWNKQLNVNGSGHARINVKTANVRMGIYAHDSWHSGVAGHVGTYTNHPLSFVINAGQKALLSTTGSLSTTSQGTLWGASNDGSGSGLDADLLDGVQGTSFLRSDAADTFTGTLTMGTQVALEAANYGRGIFGVYSASVYQHVWSMGSAYKLADNGVSSGLGGNLYGLAWTYNPDYAYAGSNAQARAGFGHQLLLMMNGSAYTALGNGIWTAGTISSDSQGTLWGSANDGSGSGLDADLLDGQHGSYYFSSANYPDRTNFENIYNNLSTSTGASANLNTVFQNSKSGFIDGWSGSNFPSGTTHVQGIQARHQTGAHYGFQLVNQYNQQQVWHRQVSNNTFGAWNKIWSSSTDGSGSGLDADLLDGQQGSYYYPASNPSGYQTTSGSVAQSNYVSGNAFATTSSPSSVLEYQQASGQSDTRLSPTTDWYNSIRMGHGNPYNYYSNTIAMRMTGGGSGTMFTQHISNNSPQGWRTQWDSGNDGSGSGLDADLLDGLQPNVNASNNTIVQRNASGYIYANYFNTAPNDVSSAVTKVCVETGNDGFIRHGTPDAIALFLDGVSGGSISTATNSGAVNYVYANAGGTPTRGSCPIHVYHQWSANLNLTLTSSTWQRGDIVVVKNTRGTNVTVTATRIYTPDGSYDTSVTFNGVVGSFTLIKYSTTTGYWMVGP